MSVDALAVAAAQPTTTPEVGPDELVDVWPLAIHVAWFLVGFLGVLALGWFVVEPLVARVVRHRNQNNPTVQEALRRYVRLLVLVVAAAVGASFAGYGDALGDSALVVAAGTLAIGIAAQSVIGSLVSGLVLVLDPEFSVDDYIRWGEYEGVVRSIQLRATRIETTDGELVTIPNTQLTSDAIVRPYGRSEQRIVDWVAVDYEDDVDEAVRHAAGAAAELDGVLDSPAPRAYVDELGDDAVVVRVHYWLERPRPGDVLDARSAYARAVKARLEDAGITISPAPEHELQGSVTVDGPE